MTRCEVCDAPAFGQARCSGCRRFDRLAARYCLDEAVDPLLQPRPRQPLCVRCNREPADLVGGLCRGCRVPDPVWLQTVRACTRCGGAVTGYGVLCAACSELDGLIDEAVRRG